MSVREKADATKKTANPPADVSGDRRAVALWVRMMRLVHAHSGVLNERLRDHELSSAQFDVIAQIGSASRLTQRELADRLLVTEGNVTQLLDRLQRGGYLERHADGRCNRLVLTEKGRTIYRELVPEQNALITRQFSVLSDAEQEELSHLLRKLSHGAE
jgi:DNA-binding MarR family transcriptional regulator